ncbi:Uncharacterized protein BM_BM10077 [Brugia malayi]|uniref:Bm10077 n=1 Tax=Brugia malayi TaxID=6279 RepID=A0A0K0ILZ9_BRUMA|nr:Uncharacterized protein BM_BM10077 [Brugia malayi]CTP81350.1 Bm10077 [Brugia malayi]VIO94248.1 Uncharacterized protein BM_BM10077 [Brugia malayi]
MHSEQLLGLLSPGSIPLHGHYLLDVVDLKHFRFASFANRIKSWKKLNRPLFKTREHAALEINFQDRIHNVQFQS